MHEGWELVIATWQGFDSKPTMRINVLEEGELGRVKKAAKGRSSISFPELRSP